MFDQTPSNFPPLPTDLVLFAKERGEKDALALFGKYAVKKIQSPDELSTWLASMASVTTFAQVVKPTLLALLECQDFDRWQKTIESPRFDKKTKRQMLDCKVGDCGWAEAWFHRLGENTTVQQANALRKFAEHPASATLSKSKAQGSPSFHLSILGRLSKGLRRQEGGENEWKHWWASWGLPLVLTEQNLKQRNGFEFEALFRFRSETEQTAKDQSELVEDLAEALDNSQVYVDAVEVHGAPVFWTKVGKVLRPEALDTWWSGFLKASTSSNSEQKLKDSVANEWLTQETHRSSIQEALKAWMERTLLKEKHATVQSKDRACAL